MGRLNVSALAFTILLISCNDENPWDLNLSHKIPPVPTPGGAFAYAAFDLSGRVMVQGWLTLLVGDSANVTGEWHFWKVNDPYYTGPFSGDGQIFGFLVDTILSVNLHPNIVDSNVLLKGRYTGNTYSGAWAYDTFGGIASQGTFQAIKQ